MPKIASHSIILIEAIKRLCDSSIARCRAYFYHIKGTSAHEPTVEFFKGQEVAYKTVLNLIENKSFEVIYDRTEVLLWYTSARSDGWICEPYKDDRWGHAILKRNSYLAEINLDLGTIKLYKDGKQIEPEFPYSHKT